MGLIWWILPAIAAVIGLMLLFAGFGKLARLKAGSGAVRLTFGAGMLALAGVVAFAGLNLQTYKRLTKERYAANIKFEAVEGEANAYTLDLTFSDGRKLVEANGAQPVLRGNEFEIGVNVLREVGEMSPESGDFLKVSWLPFVHDVFASFGYKIARSPLNLSILVALFFSAAV